MFVSAPTPSSRLLLNNNQEQRWKRNEREMLADIKKVASRSVASSSSDGRGVVNRKKYADDLRAIKESSKGLPSPPPAPFFFKSIKVRDADCDVAE